MKIVVGCPFSDRSWIFDRWMNHIQDAFSGLGHDVSFVFVGNQTDLAFLKNVENTVLVEFSEPERLDVRRWNHQRYEHMVLLRNELLGAVRKLGPDLFLSLDSDILLAPNAIQSAIEALSLHPNVWAVGLKCFMTPTSVSHPSMGIWVDNSHVRFRRNDVSDIATVDIIMAAKLMKPEAYNVDYSFHKNGEDLGWSLNVKLAGGSFIWDGRVTNKHVMSPKFLDVVDRRAGF